MTEHEQSLSINEEPSKPIIGYRESNLLQKLPIKIVLPLTALALTPGCSYQQVSQELINFGNTTRDLCWCTGAGTVGLVLLIGIPYTSGRLNEESEKMRLHDALINGSVTNNDPLLNKIAHRFFKDDLYLCRGEIIDYKPSFTTRIAIGVNNWLLNKQVEPFHERLSSNHY